jgi:hypothetical protein
MFRGLIQSVSIGLVLGGCGSDATSPEVLISRLEILTGDQQTDTVGQLLPDPLVVRAIDASGEPLAGVRVTFVVTEGDGDLQLASSRTDESGLAADVWTLGPLAGEQRLEARVGDTVAVSFVATALPDQVDRILVWPDPLIAARGDTIYMGEHVRFFATALDRFGNLNSDSGFSWVAHPATKAQIDSRGLLTTTDTGVVSVRAIMEPVAGPYDVGLVRNPGNPFSLDFKLSAGEEGEYVEVPFHVSLDISAEWTLELWVKPRRMVALGPQHLIARRRINGVSYAIWLDESRFEVAIEDGTTSLRGRSARLIVPREWQHFAAVFDGEWLRLYVDGELDVELQAPVAPAHTLSSLTFGAAPFNTYDGLMDEIRIWSTARTASQIVDAMAQGLSGTEPGLVGYWRFDEGYGDTAYDMSNFLNDGRLGQEIGPDDWDPNWSVDVPLIRRH